MIAAMTLKFLDPFGTGKLVLFQVTYDKVCTHACPHLSHSDPVITPQDWHAQELLFFLILGVFGVRLIGSLCGTGRWSLKLFTGRIWCLVLQTQLPLEQERSQRDLAQDPPGI